MKEKNSYFKSQKGITLIVLIITIILMFVLAATTISATIGPDGIIARARETASKAEKHEIYEKIVKIAAIETKDGNLDIGTILEKVKEKFDVIDLGLSNEDINNKIVKIDGKKGTYNYLITRYEVKMTDDEPIKIEEGKVINFDSDLNGEKEEWIILDDTIDDVTKEEKNYIEILSCKVIGKLKLGHKDSWINWNDPKVIEAADIIKDQQLDTTEKGIYSYNNAVYTIQEYCNSLIKADNVGVRNFNAPIITERCNEKTLEEVKVNYRKFGSWAIKYAGYLYESKNYEKYDDSNKLKKLDILSSLTSTTEGKSYWKSSRETEITNTNINVGLRYFTIKYNMMYKDNASTHLFKFDNLAIQHDLGIDELGVLPIVRIAY